MTNLWNSYYLVKINAINPIKTRMNYVLSNYTTANSGYRDKLNNSNT